MLQHGQVFELETRARDGQSLWAYRCRIAGRGSKRAQQGGFASAQDAGERARRWVVERTHSWLNRFRRILVRWEKRADTYLAMLHLACGLISWCAARPTAQQEGLPE